MEIKTQFNVDIDATDFLFSAFLSQYTWLHSMLLNSSNRDT